jgi:hypothetical protein
MIVVLCACGGHQEGARVAFQVEQPHADANGNDLDDAPPSVTLHVGARQLPVGTTLGSCAGLDKTSPFLRASCAADVPNSTIASLACGDDPHNDSLVCLYAVRASASDVVELWRRDMTFVDTDGAPRKVNRGSLVRVGTTRP